MNPYAKLWKAVIAKAITDYRSKYKRERVVAEEFLFRDLLDFPDICRMAELNPEKLRNMLRARTQL